MPRRQLIRPFALPPTPETPARKNLATKRSSFSKSQRFDRPRPRRRQYSRFIAPYTLRKLGRSQGHGLRVISSWGVLWNFEQPSGRLMFGRCIGTCHTSPGRGRVDVADHCHQVDRVAHALTAAPRPGRAAGDGRSAGRRSAGVVTTATKSRPWRLRRPLRHVQARAAGEARSAGRRRAGVACHRAKRAASMVLRRPSKTSLPAQIKCEECESVIREHPCGLAADTNCELWCELDKKSV